MQPPSRPFSSQDIRNAYYVLLGREPEGSQIIEHHLQHSKDTLDLVKNIIRSNEFVDRIDGRLQQPTPFVHFNTNIDVEGIVRTHLRSDRKPVPGYLVNFLNVKIPTRVMPMLNTRGGELDTVPLPANFHADMAEWAAALRAVDLSGEKFAMIELGCGWGCWMANTGVAARAKGKRLDLVGVEGDELHIDYARETFGTNGILPDQYSIIRGIAAASDGIALFPRRQEGEADNWGYAPKFGVSQEESDIAVKSGKWDSLGMVSISAVIGGRPRIDLLHMDIQGGEADLIAGTIEVLNERVAYIVIGTHSRSLEGRLMDTLLGAGWLLEVERPAIFQVPGGQPVTTVDGVQGWRNPRLLPV